MKKTPQKIASIDVNETLKKLAESMGFDNELTRQRRASVDQAPFRARVEKDTEVEEAEDEEGDEAGRAVSAAIPQSSRRKKPEPEPEQEKAPAAPVSQERGAPIPSFDLMREKMNLIRSGKSLEDEHVDAEMRNYFEAMTDDEKLGLIAYLTGISQIVAGEVGAGKVSDPSEAPWKIRMSRTKNDQERTTRRSKERGREQRGTADAPIVVGEAANKSKELELIKLLK